jgi:hypothetical protein
MRLPRLFALACVVLGLAVPGASRAQDVPTDQFSVLRFTPAPGPRNYFQVEGASTPGHLQGSAGLVIDYGHLPFVLYDASCDADGNNCTVDGTRAELVQYTATAHLMGTFVLFDRLQIAAIVPLVLTSGGGFNSARPGRDPLILPGGDAFGLADPRLSVKGRIFTDADSGVSLGASAFVTFPTGQATAEQRFVGDPLPSFGGHFIFEMVQSGFHVAANAGGTWREETTLFSTVVGPQITYGVAAGYDITTLVGVFGEVVGASTFTSQVDEHWLEWRVGGRLRIDDFDVNLAGGGGFPGVAGVGTPLFRVIAGFQWAPIHSDSDGDGIDDSQDSCPSEAEDTDNWEDEDGCPEADNDGDGRLDGDDPCPDQAEDRDHFEDDDGCPDTDNDGDGIHDGYDSCPDEAEDVDEDRDEDGCPDNDSDRDGLDDTHDQCPEEAEDFDGFGDEDGCPEVDFDSDSVPDESDQCPDQAEDMDGFEDEDGCPEEGAPPAAAEPRRRRPGR